jgi:hypothetical protein
MLQIEEHLPYTNQYHVTGSPDERPRILGRTGAAAMARSGGPGLIEDEKWLAMQRLTSGQTGNENDDQLSITAEKDNSTKVQGVTNGKND